MARFISLLTFTDEGARNIRKSTTRAHAFDKLAAKYGVTVEGQYWTLGAFDGVLILRADDESKALHCLAELAGQGYVRTQTMSALTDVEFQQVVAK